MNDVRQNLRDKACHRTPSGFSLNWFQYCIVRKKVFVGGLPSGLDLNRPRGLCGSSVPAIRRPAVLGSPGWTHASALPGHGVSDEF